MDEDAIFAASASRRRAVADLLDSLDDKQLGTESLCAGWTVRMVGAHLLSPLITKGPALAATFVRSGFRPHVANTRLATKVAARPVAELTVGLRDNAESRFKPPVTGARAQLTDLLVHEADMRLPLGLPFDPPLADVELALDFLVDGKPFGFVPKGMLAGIRFAPTDSERAWGDGAPAGGRAADLMLAICGRTTVLASLTGEGADLLGARLSPTG